MSLKTTVKNKLFPVDITNRTSDILWGYIMIAPYFVGAIIFMIWPMIESFYFSFNKWGAFGGTEFVGWQNYVRMFQDPELYLSFKNTFIFTGLSVPVSIIIGIIVAVLLNQKIKGLVIYRTLYFLPVVTMPAAIAMVWRWLFNADYGLINYLLQIFSIDGPRWLSDPNLVLYSIIIVGIWSTIGYNMVIFLSGLQNIPNSLYEVAAIDGAGPFTQFFKITLPLLTPTIFFVTIISIINTLKVFDLVFMMIDRTSFVLENAETAVYFFYKTAFVLNEKGYASAILMFLFLIILVLTVIQTRLQDKWVHY